MWHGFCAPLLCAQVLGKLAGRFVCKGDSLQSIRRASSLVVNQIMRKISIRKSENQQSGSVLCDCQFRINLLTSSWMNNITCRHTVPPSVDLPLPSDFILQDEVKDWIIPPDYDHVEAEARHLVREADGDGVRINTKYEFTLV